MSTHGSLVRYLHNNPQSRRLLEIIAARGSMYQAELGSEAWDDEYFHGRFDIVFGALVKRGMAWSQGRIGTSGRRVGITMRGRRELVRWRTLERSRRRTLGDLDSNSSAWGLQRYYRPPECTVPPDVWGEARRS